MDGKQKTLSYHWLSNKERGKSGHTKSPEETWPLPPNRKWGRDPQGHAEMI